jgi:cytochrome c-type biogenesis protein CcmE
MNQKFIKIALTAIVLGASFGGLMWYSLRSDTEYYKHVDEVMASPQQWEGKKLQLHGFVVGVPLRSRDSLDYRFNIANKGVTVPAMYSGIVPDTFKESSEVVLKGTLMNDGFHAESIMAKCPSKYDPNKPAPGPGTNTSN